MGTRTHARPTQPVGALLLGALGALLFAGALACMGSAARYLIIEQGGQCSSGGPYVVRPGHECSPEMVRLMVGGIIVALLAGGLLVEVARRRIGAHMILPVVGVIWVCIFGVFAVNFIHGGLHPGDGGSPTIGILVAGVVFLIVAAPGVLGPWSLRSPAAPGAAPAEPTTTVRTMDLPDGSHATVVTTVTPGTDRGAPVVARTPRRSGIPWLAITLVAIAIGFAVGTVYANGVLWP